MKTCIKCNKEKLSSGFSRHGSSKDGLSHICKDCVSAIHGTASGKGQIELTDTAAVWATKPIGETYWQQMGEWMMNE